MKNRKAAKRLRARQKDYDAHLVGKAGISTARKQPEMTIKWRSLDGTIHETESKYTRRDPQGNVRYVSPRHGMFAYWLGEEADYPFRFIIWRDGRAFDINRNMWCRDIDAGGLRIDFDDWCKA